MSQFKTHKRVPTIVATALAALLVLTGCSTDDSGNSESTAADATDSAADESSGDENSQQQSGESLLPEAEGTTQYPLVLDTWAGETTLEERPERVAIIGFNSNLDVMESLDAVPVYALTEDPWPWRSEEFVESIEHVDTATRGDDIQFETIASTQPDLIIASNFIFEEADYERLAAIAPVLESPEQMSGDQVDWRETSRAVGEALDLSTAAEETITAAEKEITQIAKSHPEFAGKTITVGNDYGAEWGLSYYTVAGGTAEHAMTEYLGFAPNPQAENFVDEDVVSDENLGMLDGDALVIIYADEETREAREAMPLFQSIPAVADGRYVGLTFDEDNPTVLANNDGEEIEGANAVWVLRRGESAISLPWALDVVANNWLADIDFS
ncbi:ABC transporter substrate-binding protein [Corynebacterium casei]|uniref:ABC transporter substrate-binding protein n=1 Tax=Corynebacterium casei TaxID=160386 RepID=UPI0009D55A4F|nr:ABC transporter substrate-binding protein [Corynebacterium casei]MDN5707661.1 ABC transporter substrate-binding protein [Corynebacterium casei]MDN5730150.1 ABC transporter substrate-binding protein [Corynebacterium casei]MDN5741764.1 ABC transporter substrate-binding protein [Corynebacterium casei]MDN5799248.1 ABC transporter substrate-binding protein [Corynebacterium casei]MDN5827847.1 ABC transporter substrate-binding protein [Corynebacterium casei]